MDVGTSFGVGFILSWFLFHLWRHGEVFRFFFPPKQMMAKKKKGVRGLCEDEDHADYNAKIAIVVVFVVLKFLMTSDGGGGGANTRRTAEKFRIASSSPDAFADRPEEHEHHDDND